MTTNGRGGGAPMMPFFRRGQTEKFSGGADENLSLVLKQTTALIALGVWGVIIVTTGLWMVGSTLPIAIVSGGCLIAGYIGVRFIKAYFPEPSWAISIIAVVGVMAFALLTGTQIVMDNWPAPCTWRWEVKGVVWAIQAVVLEALWLTRYRFKYEIVDPKAQPTFQPRSGEEGVRWPSSPFDGMLEGMEGLMEEEPSLPSPGNERAIIVNPARKPPTAAQQFTSDLKDFVNRGDTLGFARSTWIQPNKARLRLYPTGNTVTRPYFDKLMSIIREAGIVTNGDAPQLTVPLAAALGAIKHPPTP